MLIKPLQNRIKTTTPVLDPHGHCIAASSVVAPEFRLT
jgi:hypothetical protein